MFLSIFNKSILRLSAALAACFICRQAAAQDLGNTPALLEPSRTQYFQNQYLANPAMAGLDSGLHINAAYRRQWGNMDGAPTTLFFTADGRVAKRVGGGLNVFNDEAGLVNRTRVALSYAYHLPLNHPAQQLHFGLSLAFNTQYIDYGKIDGETDDPSIGLFNRRDNYFEAEYGMAYTDGHWTLQGSLPNIRALVSGDAKAVNGGVIFYTAAAYEFATGGAVSAVTPKVAYRGVKGYNNILDAGVNISFLGNTLHAMAMYHTSRSFSAGIGVNILQTVNLQAYYTSQTGGIRTYVDGSYEVAATIRLFK